MHGLVIEAFCIFGCYMVRLERHDKEDIGYSYQNTKSGISNTWGYERIFHNTWCY